MKQGRALVAGNSILINALYVVSACLLTLIDTLFKLLSDRSSNTQEYSFVPLQLCRGTTTHISIATLHTGMYNTCVVVCVSICMCVHVCCVYSTRYAQACT